MKAFLTHSYILIFFILLGVSIFILEEASGLNGGFFGKHFFSTIFFLSFVGYAVLTTVVVVTVAILKYRKQQEFSAGNLLISHILTVVICVGVAYVANATWDSIKYRQFNERLKTAKEQAQTQCPGIESWQWIQVNNELALAKFSLSVRASISITLHQFFGSKSGRYFQLHPQFQRRAVDLVPGKPYTLFAAVETNKVTTPYTGENFELRFRCGDGYIAFSSNENYQQADSRYINNAPVFTQYLVPSQEVLSNEKYLKIVTELIAAKQHAESTIERPMAPRVSMESLNAAKSITKVEKHGLPLLPSRSTLRPISKPSTVFQVETNAVNNSEKECNSALVNCGNK